MKVLLATDLHIHNHLGSYDFIENCGIFLDHVLERCLKENIKYVILTGDIFNCNNYINHKALLVATEKFHNIKEKGIELILVTGNHDLFNKERIEESLTQVFSRDFFVPRTGDYKDIGDTRFNFCNYTKKFDISNFNLKNGYNVLCSHLEIDGFKMNNIVTKNHTSREELKDFNIVFNGHHHDYEHIDNVVTTGTAYHINFNDVGKKRGYIIFDTDKKEYSYEKYSGAEFIKIDPTRDINFDNVKNYFIRLEYDKDLIESSKVLEIKKKLNINNYYVDIVHKPKKKEKEEMDIEVNTFDDAYNEYIEKTSKDLDIIKLKSLYDDIKNSLD